MAFLEDIGKEDFPDQSGSSSEDKGFYGNRQIKRTDFTASERSRGLL